MLAPGITVRPPPPQQPRTTVDATQKALLNLCTSCAKLAFETKDEYDARMRLHERLYFRFRATIEHAAASATSASPQETKRLGAACLPYIDLAHRFMALYRTASVEAHAYSKLHALTEVDSAAHAYSLSDAPCLRAYDAKWLAMHAELLRDLVSMTLEFLGEEAAQRKVGGGGDGDGGSWEE